MRLPGRGRRLRRLMRKIRMCDLRVCVWVLIDKRASDRYHPHVHQGTGRGKYADSFVPRVFNILSTSLIGLYLSLSAASGGTELVCSIPLSSVFSPYLTNQHSFKIDSTRNHPFYFRPPTPPCQQRTSPASAAASGAASSPLPSHLTKRTTSMRSAQDTNCERPSVSPTRRRNHTSRHPSRRRSKSVLQRGSVPIAAARCTWT